MQSIFAPLTFRIFVVWSCLILGSSLYESVVVFPLIASNPPQSLAATNQVLAVPQRAGMSFWSWATPILGAVALAALLTSFGSPRPQMVWRIASASLVLMVVAATLLYFRPTIISLVINHGGGQPDDVIAAQMHRWVVLNWLRLASMAVSIGMAVRGFLPPTP
jgi:Domain of unknown function (DUF1772)